MESTICQKWLTLILCSSDHPILFKFHQLVVQTFIKELQVIFQTSNVSNSNGNKEELERKIYCKRLIFQWGILCYRC